MPKEQRPKSRHELMGEGFKIVVESRDDELCALPAPEFSAKAIALQIKNVHLDDHLSEGYAGQELYVEILTALAVHAAADGLLPEKVVTVRDVLKYTLEWLEDDPRLDTMVESLMDRDEEE